MHLASLLLTAALSWAQDTAKTLQSTVGTELGGETSVYSLKMGALIEQALRAPQPAPGAISLRCWTTPGDELYVGVEQRLSISAPLKAVAAVLDDFSQYVSLFPGFADIHEISRDGERIFTYWEQRIPIPFVPNVLYEVIYQISSPSADTRLYRYQLRKPTTLTKSDGFILLNASASGETSYLEVDFFNAHWGMAKMFGARRIWKDAVEGMALSDLAVKLKAENPTWENKKARRESERALKGEEARKCYEGRAPAAQLFSASPQPGS